jgi:hypothetical protein
LQRAFSYGTPLYGREAWGGASHHGKNRALHGDSRLFLLPVGNLQRRQDHKSVALNNRKEKAPFMTKRNISAICHVFSPAEVKRKYP